MKNNTDTNIIMFFISIIMICCLFLFNIKYGIKNRIINFITGDTIIIKPINGLCNKLQVIFTFLKIIKNENKKLIVLWIEDEHCPGFYLDYFEELENVTFIQNPTDEELKKYKIDYKGYGWGGKFRNKILMADFNRNYYDLKLKPYMLEKLKKNIEMLENDYVACHIRRTDHSSLANENNAYTSDKEFYDYIDNSKAKNVYIATDNRKTQDMMLSKYPAKVKVMKLIDESHELRQTTLEDSIIDLFSCVYAKEFKGCNWSSFSSTIEIIRRENKIILFNTQSIN